MSSNDCQKAKTEVSDVRLQLDDVKRELAASRKEAQKAKTEVSDVRSQLDDVKQKFAVSCKEAQTVKAQLDDVIAEASADRAKLQQTLDKMQAEFSAFQVKSDNRQKHLEEVNAGLNVQISELNNELSIHTAHTLAVDSLLQKVHFPGVIHAIVS